MKNIFYDDNTLYYPDPPYLPIMTLIMYTITFFCEIISIFLMSNLLYRAYFHQKELKVESFSNSMRTYFITHICCATPSLITLFYILLFWQPGLIFFYNNFYL